MNNAGILFPLVEPFSSVLRPLICSQNFYWISRLGFDLLAELNDVSGSVTFLPQEFCVGELSKVILQQ